MYKTVCLIEEYKQGNTQAREQLILHYMKLAEKMADSYKGLGIDEDDVLQSAYEGLIIAIDECSHRERQNYTSLIVKTIARTIKKNMVGEYFDFEGTTRNPMCDTVKLRILKIQREYLKREGRLPNEDELCMEVGVLPSIVKKVLNEMEHIKKEYLEDMTIEDCVDIVGEISDPEFDVIDRRLPVKLELPPRQKELYELFKNGTIEPSKCAEIMGISRQAVLKLREKLFKRVWANRDQNGENTTLKREYSESEKAFAIRRKSDRQQNRDRY